MSSGQSDSPRQTAMQTSMGHGQDTGQRRRAAACTQMRCDTKNKGVFCGESTVLELRQRPGLLHPDDIKSFITEQRCAC